MKRKIFSVVLALVMLLTLAPAVLAVGETEDDVELIELPTGQTVEFKVEPIDPPEDIPMAAQETTYPIRDAEDITNYQHYYLNEQVGYVDLFIGGFTFIVENDLNLKDLYSETDPYTTGAIPHLYGNIIGNVVDGKAPVISGIPDGMYFVQYAVGGTIKDLTFNYGNEQAGVSYMYTRFAGDDQSSYDYSLTLENITVEGSEAPTDVGNNYSPFVFTSPLGGLTMKNCVNNMDMVGTTYSSIFFGYRPMVFDAPITFDHCVNNGDLITNRAGMFFGNSTGLDNYISTLPLTIIDCENNGSILGTYSAYYLCAEAARDGEFGAGKPSAEIEAILAGTSENPNQYPNIHAIIKGNENQFGTVEPLQGFTGTWNGENITITPPTDSSEVDHYIVQVAAYVNVWSEMKDEESGEMVYKCNGSRLYVVSSEVTIPTDASIPYEVPMKAYGFADEDYGAPGMEGKIPIVTANNVKYYAVINNPGSEYTYSVSDSLSTPGAEPAQMVIISAYDVQGKLLGAVYLNEGAAA